MKTKEYQTLSGKDAASIAGIFKSFGCNAELELEGSAVKRITFRRESRELIVEASYSDFKIKYTKPVTEKKHVLKGTVAGLKVSEVFDTHDAAYERRRELEGLQKEGEATLEIDETEIEVKGDKKNAA